MADMSKGVAAKSLAAAIFMDCRNVMLATLKFSYIGFLKLNHYGTFTYITQYVHSNTTAHNVVKGGHKNSNRPQS